MVELDSLLQLRDLIADFLLIRLVCYVEIQHFTVIKKEPTVQFPITGSTFRVRGKKLVLHVTLSFHFYLS